MKDQVDFQFAGKHEFPTSWCFSFDMRSQNGKFVISLKYFKKEGWDKFDFLHEDNHQSFLQARSTVFTGHSHACPK